MYVMFHGHTCHFSDCHVSICCGVQVNMVRSYACCDGQLEVLGLLYPFLGQISRMERRGDQNVGVLQMLVQLAVVALFVICHDVLVSLSHRSHRALRQMPHMQICLQTVFCSSGVVSMLHYLILKKLAQAELVLDTAKQILVLCGFACFVKDGYNFLF